MSSRMPILDEGCLNLIDRFCMRMHLLVYPLIHFSLSSFYILPLLPFFTAPPYVIVCVFCLISFI